LNLDRRALQAWAVALGLVGLLALVAIGARAGHPIGHAHLHQRAVPARVGNDLLTLMLIVWGLAVVVFIAGVYAISREEWDQPKSKWLQSFVATMVVIGLLSFLGYEIVHRRDLGRRGQTVTGATATVGTAGGKLPKLPAAQKPARFDWEFAVALAGIAVLVAVYFAVRRRRDEEPHDDAEPRRADELEQVLARVVRETIDDLRGDADPRRAVIAAYARMEGILRRHGYGRRPAEAPYEYLERVLLQLNVAPEAVRELTDLFEYAKFSQHRVGGEMRDRALAAFVSIRDDLKAAAA
jgi:membrane protein implicated in regulation of membrane protease activity